MSALESEQVLDQRVSLTEIRPTVLLGVGLGLLLLPILMLAMALFAPDGISERPVLWIIPPVLSVAVAIGFAYPRWIVPGMLIILISFPILLDSVSIPLGFMRVYFTDLILMALGAAAVHHLFRRGWTVPAGSIPALYWVWLVVGAFGLFQGFVLMGHEFDRAFGDFRRAFVCLTAFLGLLLVCREDGARARLEKAVLIGCAILVVEGFWQVLTGQFYTRRFTDAAHILSKFELQFLAMGVLLAIARLAAGRVSSLYLFLAVGGLLVTILGNFRSTWLSLLGGLIVIFIYLPVRWRLIMSAYGIMAGIVSVALLALVWSVPVADGGSTLGEDLRQKFDLRNARYDVNVTWRMESYANAMNLWRERPMLGQGLGVLTEFSAPTSTGGAQIVRGHRVHNSLIWVLMSFGVVGATVFVGWIGSVFLQWHRAVVSGRLGAEDRTLVIASSAFVVSFLISTSFEIFLESGPPVIMLAVVLALGTLAAHSQVEKDQEFV